MLQKELSMNRTEHFFEKYLFETLGVSTRLSQWEKQRLLPPFLDDLYRVYSCRILERPCLVLAARSGEEISPAQVGKHIRKVGGFEPGVDVIYLHSLISPFNRKRLIEGKIPFVVPGKQMYLPFLGVDLREHLRKARTGKADRFMPATQAVFLTALYLPPGEEITPALLTEKLAYSRMTMSRALDEIEAAGLEIVFSGGRSRALVVPENRKQLFNEALPFLISPVRKRLNAAGNFSLTGLIPAGESALSMYGMLSEPLHHVYAVSPEMWKHKERHENIVPMAIHVGDSVEIEIWKYPPDLFVNQNRVDPLSLYLSLRHVQDDRVEIALEHLLKESVW